MFEGSSCGISFTNCVSVLSGASFSVSLGQSKYLHGSLLPPLQVSAPKTSVLTWLVWVGPGSKGPVLGGMSVALSSSQVEGGRSHTAKGVCEAAARVWGAAEPAHQGGPARLRVSVPLGLYTAAPHPTPLGTPLPYCLRRLSPSTPISSHPTSFPRDSCFPILSLDPTSLPLSRDLHPTDVQRLPSLSLREVTGRGEGRDVGAGRQQGEEGVGLDPSQGYPIRRPSEPWSAARGWARLRRPWWVGPWLPGHAPSSCLSVPWEASCSWPPR